MAERKNKRWLLLGGLALGAAGALFAAQAKLSAWGATAKAKLGIAEPSAQQEASAGSSQEGKKAAPRPTPTVAVEVVAKNETLRVTGSLMPDEKSSVASNASGIAAEVRCDRGSVVKKGDVLVQIDPTDAKNKLVEGQALVEELRVRLGLDEGPEPFDPLEQPEVKQARASLDLAMANFKRSEELHGKRVVSTEAFEQARTEYDLASSRYRQTLKQVRQSYQIYKTALARLAILEKAVEDTTIRAPFDGWVAERLVSVGEQISSGMQATKVVTLVRVDPLRLSLTVPQQSIGAVQPGQKVLFQVDSFPGRTFEGSVRYITPIVNSETRSLVVEAVVPNPDGLLRPGLFATAQLELGEKAPEMFVPLAAVQRIGEVAKVYVVRDGRAREQVVALGTVNDRSVEVKAGLTGKEMLVAQPERVRDGDVVR